MNKESAKKLVEEKLAPFKSLNGNIDSKTAIEIQNALREIFIMFSYHRFAVYDEYAGQIGTITVTSDNKGNYGTMPIYVR